MEIGFNPASKPHHNRNKPKRKARGEFSQATINRILLRDGFACVRCKSTNLDTRPHHVIFRSQLGTGTEDNGVTICIPCHKWAHATREGRVWFEEWRDAHLLKGEAEC